VIAAGIGVAVTALRGRRRARSKAAVRELEPAVEAEPEAEDA
jgi:hypothetical protein